MRARELKALRAQELFEQGLKHCYECNEIKPLDSFPKDKRAADPPLRIKRALCRDCVNARERENYDPEHQAMLTARHKAKDPDRFHAEALRRTIAWQKANIEKVRAGQRIADKKRYAKDRTKRIAIGRASRNKRRQNDPTFRLREAISYQINVALRRRKTGKKSRPTFQILDYTKQQLFAHIEAQFDSGMNWGNYGYGVGKWHVDHVRPIASFNPASFPTIEEFIQTVWALSNLQPLWHEENQTKGSRWNGAIWRYGVPAIGSAGTTLE